MYTKTLNSKIAYEWLQLEKHFTMNRFFFCIQISIIIPNNIVLVVITTSWSRLLLVANSIYIVLAFVMIFLFSFAHSHAHSLLSSWSFYLIWFDLNVSSDILAWYNWMFIGAKNELRKNLIENEHRKNAMCIFHKSY